MNDFQNLFANEGKTRELAEYLAHMIKVHPKYSRTTCK